ncbi:MAG: hypothetical protein L6Q98_15390 [Anaerolineae bacterium]|nr:hypothetical protein [Anaerolineae bacterium]NUQ04753.1 hypothetical protein [Anaerolineae bacterium]
MSENKPLGLRYTGHPFIDIGVAVATVVARRQHPEKVTVDELIPFLQDIKRWYIDYPGIQSFLRNVFPNSKFVQGAVSLADKEQYADEVLFGFIGDEIANDDRQCCVFFPELAASRRVTRTIMPLLNSVDTVNFGAAGNPGVPVSGLAIMCLHLLPLGCLRLYSYASPKTRLLGFHHISSQGGPNLNMVFAAYALDHHTTSIGLSGEITTFGSHSQTRYVEELLRVKREVLRNRLTRSSLTAYRNVSGYFFANENRETSIAVLHLDNGVHAFIEAAELDHADTWHRLIAANWQKVEDEPDAPLTEESRRQRRNFVFEQLFDAPVNWLRLAGALITHGDWALVHLFLKEIVNMQQAEIDNLKMLGMKLARYMSENDVSAKGLSWGFYHQFKTARTAKIRALVRSANESLSRKGLSDLIITHAEILLAFNRVQGYQDFTLARDIIAMVMFEELHKMGYSMGKAVPAEEDEIAERYAAIPDEVEA